MLLHKLDNMHNNNRSIAILQMKNAAPGFMLAADL
jgi:hypothetical protein